MPTSRPSTRWPVVLFCLVGLDSSSQGQDSRATNVRTQEVLEGSLDPTLAIMLKRAGQTVTTRQGFVVPRGAEIARAAEQAGITLARAPDGDSYAILGADMDASVLGKKLRTAGVKIGDLKLKQLTEIGKGRGCPTCSGYDIGVVPVWLPGHKPSSGMQGFSDPMLAAGPISSEPADALDSAARAARIYLITQGITIRSNDRVGAYQRLRVGPLRSEIKKTSPDSCEVLEVSIWTIGAAISVGVQAYFFSYGSTGDDCPATLEPYRRSAADSQFEGETGFANRLRVGITRGLAKGGGGE